MLGRCPLLPGLAKRYLSKQEAGEMVVLLERPRTSLPSGEFGQATCLVDGLRALPRWLRVPIRAGKDSESAPK
jgi:hypothetical protein